MKPYLLLSFLAIAIAWPVYGQEIAIVTSPQASLLDDNDRIADTVPFYHVLEVIGERTPYLTVRHGGRELRVHRGSVHRTSQMHYVNRDNMAVVRRIFEHLREASLASSQEDNDRAVELTEQAFQIARMEFPDRTPLDFWILQYKAWLKYVQGDYENAHELLDTCDAGLKAIHQEKHFQAADVLNVRASILSAEGNAEKAAALYRRALEILEAELGKDHYDTAVVYENLSHAYEALNDYPQAISAQSSSLKAKRLSVPESDEAISAAIDRLGDLLRGNDQHAEALEQFDLALQHYRQHNAHRLTEIADLVDDVIYSKTVIRDFEGAEQSCRELLESLVGMEPEDEQYFRRTALLRMGTIDYAQENYTEALEHYRQAAALASPQNYHVGDSTAWENIGLTYVQLDETGKAKAAYEQAISIYAVTVGADSDAVLDLRDHVNDLDSYRDESLGGIVQVAMPQGYLLDDEGNIEAIIPGLTVLTWYASNDDSHEVEYNGELGRVSNAQLLRRRLLPAYGVAKASDFKEIMQEVASSFTALKNADAETAQEHMGRALQRCEQGPGVDNSLYLWLKISESGMQMYSQGMDVALESLQALQERIDALNPNAYPLKIDFHAAMAGVLREQGQNDAAVELLSEARDLAVERFGKNHAVVLSVSQSLGQTLFRAGKPDEAAAELLGAVAIAESIYPQGSPEASRLVSDVSIVLTESGKFSEAAELLEEVLNSGRKFPRETHALLVAMLGKTYSRLGKAEDARKLLSTVIDVLTRPGAEHEINSPPGMLALTELGKLDLKEEQWPQAINNLNRALEVMRQFQGEDSFEASTLHRDLAEAYAALQDREKAVASLNEVLRIYEVLGGEESPQADEIRLQLRDMVAANDGSGQASGPPAYLLNLFNLTADDEQMLITHRDCSVLTSADTETSKELATLEADSKIWSLGVEHNFHRIYVRDQARYGWVHSDDVVPYLPQIIEKGEKLLRKELSKKPAALEECLNAFARSRSEGLLDNPPAAIAVLEESLATIESHYKFSNALSALLYEDLLKSYQATGQKAQANAAAEKGLKHFLEGHGYFHPATAEVRMVRAGHHRDMGNLFKEASELNEILSTCNRCFGPQAFRTSAHRLGYATNRIRGGFFEEASKIYHDIRAIHQGDQSEAVLLRAVASLGLGGEKALQKDYVAAIQELESAQRDFTFLRVPIPSLMGQTLTLLAWCKAHSGELDEAQSLLSQTQSLPLGPADASLKLSILTLQSRLAVRDLGSAAADLAGKAVEFSTKEFGPDHFFGQDAHRALGRALLLTDTKLVAQQLDTARRLVNTYVADHVMFQSPERQISFLSSDQHSLDEALNLVWIQEGEAEAEMAAAWLINGHHLLPEVLAKRRQVLAALRNERDHDNFVSWSGRRRERAEVPLKFQIPGGPPEIQDAIRGLQSEEKMYFSGLPEDVQQMLTEKRQWITCDDLRQRMRPDEALVVVRKMPYRDAEATDPPNTWNALGPHIYAAWIISANRKVQPVMVGSADALDGMVSDLLRIIAKNVFGSAYDKIQASDVRAEQEMLTKLSKQLWQPISAKLPKDTKYLTLCLDGGLQAIPWVALSDTDGKMLIESMTIRHVSSPRDLMRKSPTMELSEPVMMFGAVLLDKDPDLAEYPRDSLATMSRQTKGSGLPFEKSEFKKEVSIEFFLPQGIDEAEAVSEVFGRSFGDDPLIYWQSSASEFRYFSTLRPRALHIAAPGFLLEPKQVELNDGFSISESRTLMPAGTSEFFNPLVHSGLLMAGFSRNETKHHLEDGILTAEEIVSQDLRGTELVVLTVCASPMGKFEKSSHWDGIVAQAFQLAGARSVVSSIWQQEEEQRTPFIKAFYTNRANGMKKAEALRNAQLKMRQAARQPFGAATVAAWAAFRITGEG